MPMKKVILLAGPPGLGKTTMVQIIARHCGYYPVEINARWVPIESWWSYSRCSDDRSPENIRVRIEALNHTRSGGGTKSNGEQLMKPCCLILDEIDGASPAAVTVLTNAINCSSGSAAADTDTPVPSTGRKKSAALGINRPIIAICNDLYVLIFYQLFPIWYGVMHLINGEPISSDIRASIGCYFSSISNRISSQQIIAP